MKILIRIICPFLLIPWLLAGCGTGRHDTPFPERGFVSSFPAKTWEEALVSGNGKYGALVFGNPLDETVILNHARLYMPVHEPLPPVNTGANIDEIRKLIARGMYRKAAQYVVDVSKDEGYGEKRWTDPFIPAFNIRLTMNDDSVSRNYSRSVDFSTGVASVRWDGSAGSFNRRLFVSRADDAVIMSVEGSRKGTVNCIIRLATQPPKGTGGWSPEKMFREGIAGYRSSAEGNWLTYTGSFRREWEGSIKGYEGISRIVTKGGSSRTSGDSLIIAGADEVLVLTKLELLYDISDSGTEEMKRSLSDIEPDFDQLLERHTAIHGEIFNRSRLRLEGGSDRNLTSEELIASSKIGNLNPALLEKEYDAARYNILSSSGELFPNLQGIWSGTYGPYWSGDFTLNGNVQSAISANLPAGMAECLLPFFRYMEDHMDEFRTNAKLLFGCGGINVPSRASNHCLKNCFEAERPMTFWTAGAGWVSQFYFDYYLYTGDVDFLGDRAYPFMKEAARFYEDFLVTGDDGILLFSPSLSPENTPSNSDSQAGINSAMDIGVARELLNNCIKACRILGTGNEDTLVWKEMLEKMPGYIIGNNGAVKEWSTPLLEENDAHRHASHLYALFNGMPDEIAADTSLVRAFSKALLNRLEIRKREFSTAAMMDFTDTSVYKIPDYTPAGDNGEIIHGRPPGEMAFGIVQQGFAAASLRMGDECAMILDWLANCYWLPNFMSTHNPVKIFNTDLSGGLPALIIRMLVDSQPGWVEPLPAWPASMPAGTIEGVALRGGITARELSWKDNEIRLRLLSHKPQRTEIRSKTGIESVLVNGNQEIIAENGRYFILLPGGEEIICNVRLK